MKNNLEEQSLNELAERMVRISLNRSTPQPPGEIYTNSGEGRLLIYLLKDKTDVLVGVLTRDLKLSSGRAANLLRQLEAKHYIRRTQCLDDRRKYIVSLTEDGRKKADRVYQEMKTYHRTLLESLGREDALHLVRILEKTAEWSSE